MVSNIASLTDGIDASGTRNTRLEFDALHILLCAIDATILELAAKHSRGTKKQAKAYLSIKNTVPPQLEEFLGRVQSHFSEMTDASRSRAT